MKTFLLFGILGLSSMASARQVNMPGRSVEAAAPCRPPDQPCPVPVTINDIDTKHSLKLNDETIYIGLDDGTATEPIHSEDSSGRARVSTADYLCEIHGHNYALSYEIEDTPLTGRSMNFYPGGPSGSGRYQNRSIIFTIRGAAYKLKSVTCMR